MKDYQERVAKELEDLSGKIRKLDEFIRGSSIFLYLPETEQALLHKQLGIMMEYQSVLRERIVIFKKES